MFIALTIVWGKNLLQIVAGKQAWPWVFAISGLRFATFARRAFTMDRARGTN